MSGLSLDAFKPRRVTVRIVEDVAGETVELLAVELAALTYAEMVGIDLAVPLPEQPMIREMVNGKLTLVPATEGEEYDEYQEALDNQVAQRNRRRLVTSLIKAGNLPELADKPIAEQVAALDTFDKMYIDKLMTAMVTMYTKGRIQVDNLAARFPETTGTGANHADMPAEWVEPEPVGEANGTGA